MTDLKKLLMELGNELVISCGADPHTDSRCVAIQKLTDELNAWGGVGVEDSGEAMRGQLELVDTLKRFLIKLLLKEKFMLLIGILMLSVFYKKNLQVK